MEGEIEADKERGIMEDILLSVVVPVYNAEKYLNRCIDSILNQTYKNLEIICVDDGSTDASGAILDRYAKDDKRIKVVHKKNGGLVPARKAGLEIAEGEYVAHVDSDDWIEQEMYSEVMHIVSIYEPDVVCTGIIRDYGDTYACENCHAAEGIYEGKELKDKILSRLINVNRFFEYNIGPHLVTKIAKREHIKEYYYKVPNDTDLCEDLVSSYPMLLNSKKVYISEKAFYHYVSISNSMVNEVNDDKVQALENTYKFFADSILKFEDVIPSIRKQYEQLKVYDFLCTAPDKVMRYDDGLLYPYGKIGPAAKIVLYGAGSFGKHLKTYIEKYTDLKIVAWADKSGDGKEIITPDLISDFEYDVILIGVLLAEVTDAIYDSLVGMGIPKEKVYRINGYKRFDNLYNGS